MFATLLSTGGVYLYGQYIDNQLDEEITALNNEISSFSGEDLARVTEFDLRLQQASSRLENSVSITSVFEALQAATIGTVQIMNLKMTREADEKFILTAQIETDSFDSTIFQRGEFRRSNIISEEIVISGVNTDVVANTNQEGSVLSTGTVVSFSALLEVPLSNVPYVPSASAPAVSAAPITISQPDTENAAEDTSSSEVTEDVVNNDPV